MALKKQKGGKKRTKSEQEALDDESELSFEFAED